MTEPRADAEVLLRIEDLHVAFDTYRGTVHALSGVDLDLNRGTITGLVGETGCGKSITAKAVLGLIAKPGRIVSGKILLEGADLTRKTEPEMMEIRGKTIAMIFQNARASLNPVFTIADQMHFVLERHQGLDRGRSREKTIELLRAVGIGDPAIRLQNYPFEMSTGMCQRVMISMALSCRPKLLIADEPTTGLDVTIQAQVLELLVQMVRKSGTTALLITHDLGVVAEMCEYTAIMYAGRVVEFGESEKIFNSPLHPYTQGLLESSFRVEENDRVHYIPGTVPDLIDLPPGCLFAPRCSRKMPVCEQRSPAMVSYREGQQARCFALGDGCPLPQATLCFKA
jgi:oligopeptide/dipeptide ABC transporter ATP-binding protein